MTTVQRGKAKIASGGEISAEEAEELYAQPLGELLAGANDVRRAACGDRFDLCTILNAKSGRCSEDCKYCAQSAHFATGAEEYPLVSAATAAAQAARHRERGILRFSLVTSGKRLSDTEVDEVCRVYRALGGVGISLCASHGLLNEEQLKKLREAGVTRYHNNLETSRRYFPKICTTHTYDDKLATIRAAQRAGLSVCSGGILGLGETVRDRIDMAIELRDLGVKSVPLNVLHPIPGTPLGKVPPLSREEVLRSVAVFRFLLPDAAIRLAGGRKLLEDGGKAAFLGGANAAISGDMLTTSGCTVEQDLRLIREAGYTVEEL